MEKILEHLRANFSIFIKNYTRSDESFGIFVEIVMINHISYE